MNLFNLRVRPVFASNHTYRIEAYSKAIAQFFNKSIGLPVGKKARIIKIPKTVKNSNHILPCLRGIIDADFYLASDRGYPEFGAWFASRGLVVDLQKEFIKLGMHPKVRLDTEYYDKRWKKHIIRHQIRIRKKADVKIWFEKIGTKSKKLYNRYFELLG